MSFPYSLKQKAIDLRKTGRTYTQINKALNINIPKSTLSYWFKGIPLPDSYSWKIDVYNKKNLGRARKIAWLLQKKKREEHLESLRQKNLHLSGILNNKDVAMVVLTILYITEGSRGTRGSIMFGNSDPYIISLFLKLLRFCHPIDESKFRCTVQIRADQNIATLERFWTKITGIPRSQFYKARIDPRTIGKISKKPDYKGVCRIDYFSAEVLNEVKEIAKIIHAT